LSIYKYYSWKAIISFLILIKVNFSDVAWPSHLPQLALAISK